MVPRYTARVPQLRIGATLARPPCARPPRQAASAIAGAMLAIAFAPVATAGDYADGASSAFRPTASTFAFEEFGVQDGSGFAYSNIYLIDVDANASVRGTPIRRNARG